MILVKQLIRTSSTRSMYFVPSAGMLFHEVAEATSCLSNAKTYVTYPIRYCIFLCQTLRHVKAVFNLKKMYLLFLKLKYSKT